MAKTFQVDTGGTLTTSLQAYYKLEDATEYYIGGGTLDMTNNGTVTFASGKVSNGSNHVATSSQYLSLASNLGATNGSYSIAGWYKVSSQPTAGNYFSAFAVFEAANDTGLSMAYSNEGGVFKLRGLRTRHNVADEGPQTVQTLTNNTWYHIAVTYDGTNVRNYLDGSQLGLTTAASGNGNAGSANVAWIGVGFAEQNSAGFYHNGMVDEVGFWSKALSSTEITDLYNGGSGQTMVESSGVVLPHPTLLTLGVG